MNGGPATLVMFGIGPFWDMLYKGTPRDKTPTVGGSPSETNPLVAI